MEAQAAAPARESLRRSLLLDLTAIAGLLVVFVALLVPTLDEPLLERHSFRQTQTAYTARIFHDEGIDLLHPRVPVLGEPFEIPFELPLYQAAASLVMKLGVAEDKALRVTTLACFVLTALLLFGLVRSVAGRVAALAAVVAFVVTPFAVVWSRASMIEYAATAGAVGFAWAFIAWRDHRHPAVGALCLAAGLVGMLVKPTTAIFWLLPALAYRPVGPRHVALRRDLWAIAFLVVPVAAAVAWTLHADAIKGATATTEWLTSEALRTWNFGTLEQRLDPTSWGVVAEWYLLLIGPLGALLLAAAAVALWRSEQRRFWIGVACALFLPPLVFTNLYVVHDYYATAVTPPAAALVGLGTAFVLGRLRETRARAAAAAVAVAVVTVWFWGSSTYWSVVEGGTQEEATVLGLAEELGSVTEPSDLVAAEGLDWNPAVFYYAGRRGHMVVDANRAFAYDLLAKGPYAHLVVSDPADADLGFTSRWPWLGSLSEHVYAIADRPGELGGASLVTTDEVGVEAHLADAPTLGPPRSLPCGTPVVLRAGSEGTWLELSDPAPRARVSAQGLAPVPARRFVFVEPDLATSGEITLTCTGVADLALVDRRDAAALPEGQS
jgi:hypothetical protein